MAAADRRNGGSVTRIDAIKAEGLLPAASTIGERPIAGKVRNIDERWRAR